MPMSRPIRCLLLAGAPLLLSDAPLRADTIHVDDDACPSPGTGSDVDPYCSIQSALDAAVNTDEIVVAPGTYNETIDFLGKAVTLRSSGGRDVTTIDAAGLNDRVVYCVSGEGPDTVLDGFTITNGLGVNGGGMRILNSSPTILRSRLIENVATNSGGGAFNNGGSPTFMQVDFLDNISDGGFAGGGGFSSLGPNPKLFKCTFLRNSAPGSGGGGAIRTLDSQIIVANCVFVANASGGSGAAINIEGGNRFPDITNCCFIDNTSDEEGSAIYTDDFGSVPTVTNCIFRDHVGQTIAGEGIAIVTHSNLESNFPGTGNISADPMFITNPSPGLDGDWGTTDDDFGDLHLMETSPCINAGDRAAPQRPPGRSR